MAVGIVNSVITPAVVMRPILLSLSVNHSAPSGPTVMPKGMLAVGVNYGFGQHDREKQPADVYVNELTELLGLTKNHR